MYETIQNFLQQLLGYDENPLRWYHVLLRAAIIYASGLALVRIGKRRFMGQYSALDVILGVTVGALLASAATSAAAFSNAVFLVFTLGLLHWLMSYITYKFDTVDRFLKGKPYPIVTDGQRNKEQMRNGLFSEEDLALALRKRGITRVEQVEEALFERSGEITIRPKASKGTQEVHVVEVKVSKGVQRVVIEVRS